MATETNAPITATAPKRQERPHWVLDDAVYSLSAALLSVIIIHSIWTLIIRPRAEAVLGQRVEVKNSANATHRVLQLRSIYVILKDREQETCVILCLWSLLLLGRQAWLTQSDRKLLERDYVKIGEEQVVLPQDPRVYSRPLEALPREEQDGFLPRLLM